MNNELYKALKGINIENLDDADKLELIKIFMNTDNSLIRNHIAFIFSDLRYNQAIPYIIKKINQKGTFNANGSLIHALENLDTQKYFTSFIKMICEQEYEARLMAYGIIQKYSDSTSHNTKQLALKTLRKYKTIEEQMGSDKGENSKLHFIEKTEKLLQ